MTQNKKRLGLRVPESLYMKLSDKSEEQGKTMNALCLEIFWIYFKKEESVSRIVLAESEGKANG